MADFPPWSLAEVLARRPAIRVNQLGYRSGGPLQATVITDATGPQPVVLRDHSGAAIWSGRTAPWPVRPEPTSGQRVQLVDFTGAPPARRVRLESAGAVSHWFDIGTPAYSRLATDALGVLTRLRCRHDDRAIPAWTGPEAERLYPGWRATGVFDVSGGWYDAGDYGKYTTSGAIALWQLASTLELSGSDPQFVSAVRAEARWQLDWLLRMQVPDHDPLAGMAFHRVHGTEWSPVPGRPEDDPTVRVLHRPSTSATLQLAAVAAQGVRHWRAIEPAYADRLRSAAVRAYAAAQRHPDLLAPDDQARYGGGPYGDDDTSDDLYWAAAELWLTTGDPAYAAAVTGSPWHELMIEDLDGFDFDRVVIPAKIDLAQQLDASKDRARLVGQVVDAADRLVALQDQQAWGQPYAPADGWAWGSNGRLLNNVVVIITADRLTGDERYRRAATMAVDYLFGRNGLGQSYVTGYGVDDTHHQRTRQFGHDLDPSLPPAPPGALAGGANAQPHPDFPYDERLRGLPSQLCYLDEPTSEVTNDICIRWNAPLVYVSAYLAQR